MMMSTRRTHVQRDITRGEMVDLDRAIPNARGEACHKRCWAEYTGAPDWFSDYA